MSDGSAALNSPNSKPSTKELEDILEKYAAYWEYKGPMRSDLDSIALTTDQAFEAIQELLKQEYQRGKTEALTLVYHEGMGEVAELAARHLSGELDGERSYVSMAREDYDKKLEQEYQRGALKVLNELHRFGGKDYDTELDEHIDDMIAELEKGTLQ